MSTLSSSNTFVSGVLGLLIFIGLKLFLPDHLVLIYQWFTSLGFMASWEGQKLECVTIIPWCCHFLLLSSWNACTFHLRGEMGSLFLLHAIQIMNSMVWSFLFVYVPLTVLMVKLASTLSVGKHVLINLKIKSQNGADFSYHFYNVKSVF